MYTLFNPGKLSDKNVFHYTHAEYMRSRIYEYLGRYSTLRRDFAGRLKSNHLFINILSSMNVEFDGSLIEFLGKCDRQGTALSRTLGLTSSYNTGKLFKGTLYAGCDEIIIQSRNSDHMWFDLWNRWRSVSAVKIISHPVTDLTVFEMGVMNEAAIETPGLVVYSIDIAVMYAQWCFYRSSMASPTMEGFITQIVIPNAIESHMNIVPFNRLLAGRGIVPFSTVKSNLPFNQQSVTTDLDRVLVTVEKNIEGRRLRPNQYLSAIPSITGDNFFDDAYNPELMPTSQAMWAIIASKFKQTAFLLEIGEKIGGAGFTDFLVRVKRTVIEVEQQNLLGTGLSSDASALVKRLFKSNVTDRLT